MKTYLFCHLEENDNQIYLACTDILSTLYDKFT